MSVAAASSPMKVPYSSSTSVYDFHQPGSLASATSPTMCATRRSSSTPYKLTRSRTSLARGIRIPVSTRLSVAAETSMCRAASSSVRLESVLSSREVFATPCGARWGWQVSPSAHLVPCLVTDGRRPAPRMIVKFAVRMTQGGNLQIPPCGRQHTRGHCMYRQGGVSSPLGRVVREDDDTRKPRSLGQPPRLEGRSSRASRGTLTGSLAARTRQDRAAASSGERRTYPNETLGRCANTDPVAYSLGLSPGGAPCPTLAHATVPRPLLQWSH